MTEKTKIIETNRLVLRRYCKEDLHDLYEYLSDEAVVRFEPYKPMDMDEVKDSLDWRISTDEMVAVELKKPQIDWECIPRKTSLQCAGIGICF